MKSDLNLVILLVVVVNVLLHMSPKRSLLFDLLLYIRVSVSYKDKGKL